MINTMFSTPLVFGAFGKGWSPAGVFRTLRRHRQEIKRISALARRERLQLGYRRVPQRVWDRRSALFIER